MREDERRIADRDVEELAWRFALAVYAEPGVATACLALQDEAGIDVVLLLAAGFQARRGLPLDEEEIARLALLVAEWRSAVVLPLRAVRRRLKQADPDGREHGIQALRRHVKDDELMAERLELATLVRALEPAADWAPVPVLGQLQRALRSTGEPSAPDQHGRLTLIAAAMERLPAG